VHDYLVSARLIGGGKISRHTYWLVNKLFEDVLLLNGNPKWKASLLFAGVQLGCWTAYLFKSKTAIAEARALCRLDVGNTVRFMTEQFQEPPPEDRTRPASTTGYSETL
jgi:hypothetical protein